MLRKMRIVSVVFNCIVLTALAAGYYFTRTLPLQMMAIGFVVLTALDTLANVVHLHFTQPEPDHLTWE